MEHPIFFTSRKFHALYQPCILCFVMFFFAILVDSATHMLGSYGPKEVEQSSLTPVDEAPSGMIARGSYK